MTLLLGVPTQSLPPPYPPLLEWRALHALLSKLQTQAAAAGCPAPAAWAIVDDDTLLDGRGVHFSSQPELFLSPKPPNSCHKKCSCQVGKWTSISAC